MLPLADDQTVAGENAIARKILKSLTNRQTFSFAAFLPERTVRWCWIRCTPVRINTVIRQITNRLNALHRQTATSRSCTPGSVQWSEISSICCLVYCRAWRDHSSTGKESPTTDEDVLERNTAPRAWGFETSDVRHRTITDPAPTSAELRGESRRKQSGWWKT